MVRHVLFGSALVLCAGVLQANVLVVNEDNDRYLLNAKAHDLTPEGLRDYLDSVAAGGAVTHFFMCVNGQRTSYGSKVWEPIWLGINQPARNGAVNWPWCVNAKLLHDRGIDPYRIWIDRAREKGISPWISLRMNDVHFANSPKRICRNEDFWYDHPEWHRRPNRPRDGKSPWGDYAWDYSHPEVRAHMMALVREVLDRWDMDGLELDWMRFNRCLTPGKEREQACILTDFMREIRREADAAAKRLGHPVKLGVRVPATVDIAASLGFDVAAWAKERLFDLISPSGEYATPDYVRADLKEWLALVRAGHPDALVVPGTDIQFFNGRNKAFGGHLDVGLIRGWVANNAGADGYYFFNAPYWRELERRMLYAGELTGPEIVRERRRFPVGCRNDGITPEQKDLQLDYAGPGTGRTYRVDVTKGPYDRTARLVLGYRRDEPPPAVALNGVEVTSPARRLDPTKISPDPKYLCCGWVWDVPADAVSNGVNFVRIVPSKQPVSLVIWLEIAFDTPADAGVRLWPEGKMPCVKEAPGAPYEWMRKDGTLICQNVAEPSVRPYLVPDAGLHPAVVVCPGGGYGMLCVNKEGSEIAAWLNRQGFHAFVLRYRVPDNRAGAFCDVQRAIRTVRARAAEYGVDTNRVGVIGFSAGGNLAARAASAWRERPYAAIDTVDDASARPDFALLVYPWNLVKGEDREKNLPLELRPEFPVDATSPQTFVVQTMDDPFHVENAFAYADALKRAGVGCELHVYPKGGHGYALRSPGSPHGDWPTLAARWLRGFLGRPGRE